MMKNPFRKVHDPIHHDSPVDGIGASTSVGCAREPDSEVGEQTEMLTRLRRRNGAESPSSPSTAERREAG
jgi:hypothetical protein